jgi:hypothetical protein
MSEVLGKISFLDIPDVNGVNVFLNAGNTPSLLADILANRPSPGTVGRLFVDTTNNVLQRDTGSLWVNISSALPADPTTAVQFNNAGAFGASSFFTWSTATNSLRINNGTPGLQLNLGGNTDPGTASLYCEVATTGVDIEAQRTYFNRGIVANSAWITHGYDGTAPYTRLLDGDHNPSYISFATLGTGSYVTPEFTNTFGTKGTTAVATDGFSWKTNGTEIATLDSAAFLQPRGTTAQRPVPPVPGMTRYNSTLEAGETYQATSWVQHVGILAKSVVSQSITVAGGGALINTVIPGGTLGTNRMLRIRTAGYFINGSGANRTITIGVVYGGTTMWQDTSTNVTNNGVVGWNIDLILASNNSVSSQTLNGLIQIGAAGNQTTGITGDLVTDEITSQAILTGSSAVNSNNDQTLLVDLVALSGNGTIFTQNFYYIEVL